MSFAPLCWEFFFCFFPAQLLQFSLFFWLRVQKCFSTASYIPWCLLFKKKIKVSDLCGTPIFFLLKYTHFQPFSNKSGPSLCFPPSGWVASLLLPLLLSVLACVSSRDSIYEGSKLTKALFLLLIRFILSWTPSASAGTGGPQQYISHSFN